jgi:hypothetical protein
MFDFALAVVSVAVAVAPVFDAASLAACYTVGLVDAYLYVQEASLRPVVDVNDGLVAADIDGNQIFAMLNIPPTTFQHTVTYSSGAGSSSANQPDGTRETIVGVTMATFTPAFNLSAVFPGVAGLGAPVTFTYSFTKVLDFRPGDQYSG